MKKFKKLAEIQEQISTGSLSCRGLVDFYLQRIEEQSSLNLFVEVFDEEARKKAEIIDRKIMDGKAGRLAGMVIGIKDLICFKDHELTASSRILQGFRSLFTATALQRLLDEDVIVIGRQNCDEFAMGSSNENSFYGPAGNPYDPARTPGGSSGASAAAVSAGLCHASLGSDTGGSVRQPASMCGVVGAKPTYGRISRWGLIAYASSFDQIGPITHSVEDAALMLEIMAGQDRYDNTSASNPVPAYHTLLQNKDNAKYTIGYLKEAVESEGLDAQIQAQTYDLLNKLDKAGHKIHPLSFPYLPYVVPCYYVLTTAEASSNLSRFDGIRYGYRAGDSQNLEDVYIQSRSEGFGGEVKRRIMLGTFVLSAGYYDAYYNQAMKVRQMIRQKTREMLKECDFILTPTVPAPAFELGEKSNDPVAMFLSDIFTVHANLAGVPAISLPMGQHSSGLPFGIQLMAGAFQETELFRFSDRLMKGDY